MVDLRPIAYVVGRMLLVLAALMLAPAIADFRAGSVNGYAFLTAAIITASVGAALALTTANALGRAFEVRDAYLLTAAIWFVLPAFAAIPFMYGAPGLGFTDGYFEAVSGITTTGSSVIVGLADQPSGVVLWRAILNWTGGLGIAFIAMIFLPVMRVGGMQFFRTEGFDTFGKALPRAADIAGQLLLVYLGLTVACGLVYAAIGMTTLDAVCHALATIATGGFSPQDTSFNPYRGAGEYAGAFFMFFASLPYIRYVQLVNGSATQLWRDSQIRAYARWLGLAVATVSVWRIVTTGAPVEPTLRETLFNLTSVMSSTGFGTGDFYLWGGYAFVVAFVVGVIGACSGSSAAGLSVFRVQVALEAVRQQVRQIIQPDRVARVKYDSRTVEPDVMNALILYVVGFVLSLGVMTVIISQMGVDGMSALWGVWTSIGNIGYGMGPLVARTGTFIDYPDAAKWVMILAMIMGRLGLLAIFVLVLPRFWRN